MKVLVASSEEMVRHMALKALTSAGFDVKTVRDGDEAWERIEQETGPLIVVLDWDLPMYDGLCLCRKMRSMLLRDYVYVLLLAIRKNKMDELVALEAGIDDYMMKPFLADELVARVNIGRRVVEHERRLSSIISGYRTLTDACPFAMVALDEKGIVKRMNMQFARQIASDAPGEHIGRSIGDVLSLTREESAWMMRQLQERRVVKHTEWKAAWRLSPPAPTYLYGYPVVMDDSIRYVLTFTHGVAPAESAAKEHEQQAVTR